MNGFLLDTDVVSIFAPGKPEAPTGFSEWLERMDLEGKLFLCVVTVHEIEKGVALLESKGATGKALALRAWLDGLVAAHGDRILGVDAHAASASGRFEAAALAGGHDPGMADALVAGVAKAHDLVVASRNARHFLALGAAFLSPEEACAAL